MLYRKIADSRITVCRYYLRRARGRTRSQRYQLCEHHQYRLRTRFQYRESDVRRRITLKTSVLGCFDNTGRYNVMDALNMILLKPSHFCTGGTRRLRVSPAICSLRGIWFDRFHSASGVVASGNMWHLRIVPCGLQV